MRVLTASRAESDWPALQSSPLALLCPATNLTFRDFLLLLRWLPPSLLSALGGVYTRAGGQRPGGTKVRSDRNFPPPPPPPPTINV